MKKSRFFRTKKAARTSGGDGVVSLDLSSSRGVQQGVGASREVDVAALVESAVASRLSETEARLTKTIEESVARRVAELTAATTTTTTTTDAARVSDEEDEEDANTKAAKTTSTTSSLEEMESRLRAKMNELINERVTETLRVDEGNSTTTTTTREEMERWIDAEISKRLEAFVPPPPPPPLVSTPSRAPARPYATLNGGPSSPAPSSPTPSSSSSKRHRHRGRRRRPCFESVEEWARAHDATREEAVVDDEGSARAAVAAVAAVEFPTAVVALDDPPSLRRALEEASGGYENDPSLRDRAFHPYVDGPDALFEMAEEAYESFAAAAIGLAAETDGVAVVPPLPDRAAFERAVREEHRDGDGASWHRATNVVRATVVYERAEGVARGVARAAESLRAADRRVDGDARARLVVFVEGAACELTLIPAAALRASLDDDDDDASPRPVPLEVAFAAAARGDAAALDRAADARIRDARTAEGDTALHLAARGGHERCAWLLLDKHGCDPAAVNDRGESAVDAGWLGVYANPGERSARRAAATLSRAAPPAEAERAVRERGAVLERRLVDDPTLVDEARRGDVGRVGSLLRAFADPRRSTSTRDRTTTALRAATRRGRTEVVRLLLRYGADPNETVETDDDDEPAPPSLVEEALRGGHVAVADALRDAGADCAGTRWDSLVHRAARGDVDGAARLLEAGVDPDSTDADGRTALDAAISNDDERVIESLLAHGVSLDDDVVQRALDAGSLRAVDLLGRVGGAPHAPLVRSAASDRDDDDDDSSLRLVETLLDRGVHPDSVDERGVSAMRAAARAGRRDVVQLLLRRGASVAPRDRDRSTPLLREALEAERGSRRLDKAVPFSRSVTALLLEAGADRDDVGLLTRSLPLPDADASPKKKKNKKKRDWRWHGVAAYDDRKLFCAPYNDDSVLVIDDLSQTTRVVPLGDDHVRGGSAQWVGVARCGGKLYCAPHNADAVLVIDGETETTTRLPLPDVKGSTGQKWAGVALCPGTNKLFCAPFHADSVLVVDADDPENVELRTIPCRGGAGSADDDDGDGDGHAFSKWFGIASYGTKLFCAPLNADAVLVVDGVTERARRVPLSREHRASGGDGFRWMGVARRGDRLYCAPFHADRVLVIDGKTETVRGTIARDDDDDDDDVQEHDSRHASFGSSSSYAAAVAAKNSRWQGAATLTSNGALVCAPSRSDALLVVDERDRARTLRCVVGNDADEPRGGRSLDRCSDVAATRDGTRLYCAPACANEVLVIEDGRETLARWEREEQEQ